MGQPAAELDSPVQDLPCGTPQVGYDTVSMVRDLRGQRDTVYDLQVDGNSNFFAEEVLVHNCVIIDDPHKNRKDADSLLQRTTVWDWWADTARTRLSPTASVVVTKTTSPATSSPTTPANGPFSTSPRGEPPAPARQGPDRPAQASDRRVPGVDARPRETPPPETCLSHSHPTRLKRAQSWVLLSASSTHRTASVGTSMPRPPKASSCSRRPFLMKSSEFLVTNRSPSNLR